MKFDQWLIKHKDKRFAVGWIAKEFIETGYDPFFKYRYCELFVRAYHYALYEYGRSGRNLKFDDWLFSKVLGWGKTENLSRDVIDCFTTAKEKYKYCKKYVRFFETCAKKYTGGQKLYLYSLELPLNLDSKIEGVRRVSLHLMEHPCFHGFNLFPELKKYPSFEKCVYHSEEQAHDNIPGRSFWGKFPFS